MQGSLCLSFSVDSDTIFLLKEILIDLLINFNLDLTLNTNQDTWKFLFKTPYYTKSKLLRRFQRRNLKVTDTLLSITPAMEIIGLSPRNW
jgi:hypothetical protein